MKIKPELIDTRSGKRIRLYKNPTVIGRHRSCEVCLPIVEVSRRHCKIFEEGDDYYVEDLKSVNGTFINEQAVSGRAKLVDGAHLKLSICTKFPAGAKVFVFRHPKPRVVRKVEVAMTDSERRDVRDILPKIRIPLKHCVFRVAKKTVLGGGEVRVRVPIQRLTSREVHFLALVPYKAGESLTLAIEHPKIEPPVGMTVKVIRILAMKGKGVQVYRVETQVTKFSDKDQDRYRRAIETTPLVRYGFLRSKSTEEDVSKEVDLPQAEETKPVVVESQPDRGEEADDESGEREVDSVDDEEDEPTSRGQDEEEGAGDAEWDDEDLDLEGE